MKKLLQDVNINSLKEKIKTLVSREDFILIIQSLVNEAEETSARIKKAESDLSEVLMFELEQIGWERVVEVNENLTSIKLKEWDSTGRQHHYIISLSEGYPNIEPVVKVSLPNPLLIQWDSNSKLYSITQLIKNELKLYEVYFSVRFIVLNIRVYNLNIFDIIRLIMVNIRLFQTLMKTRMY